MTDAIAIKDPIEQTRAFRERPTYGFASTRGILDTFAGAGWQPVMSKVLKPRKEERIGFQRHIVRLEHPDYHNLPGLSSANQSRPQLVLTNSHDASSSLRLAWGLFRIICMNGLVAGSTIADMRIVHSRRPMGEQLPAAIGEMLKAFPRLCEQANQLQSKILTQAAVAKLVRTLYDARLAGVKNLREVEYTLPALRREEDDQSDAYTVMNRLQECLMRGGITYTYDRVTGKGDAIERTPMVGMTRAVHSIDQQVKLNRLAYDTVMEVAG